MLPVPIPTGSRVMVRPSRVTVRRCAVRSTASAKAVRDSHTSSVRSQPCDPFGRTGNITWSQPSSRRRRTANTSGAPCWFGFVSCPRALVSDGAAYQVITEPAAWATRCPAASVPAVGVPCVGPADAVTGGGPDGGDSRGPSPEHPVRAAVMTVMPAMPAMPARALVRVSQPRELAGRAGAGPVVPRTFTRSPSDSDRLRRVKLRRESWSGLAIGPSCSPRASGQSARRADLGEMTDWHVVGEAGCPLDVGKVRLGAVRGSQVRAAVAKRVAGAGDRGQSVAPHCPGPAGPPVRALRSSPTPVEGR
ncbi:exported hypothetical protein [Frankia sp. AiPs1]